jgi:ubiquitin carboxyl-terminal hydrolase 7
MIFVKHFNVEEQTLKGVGHFYVHKHLKVSDLATLVNEHMHYPVGSPLKIYEVRAVRDSCRRRINVFGRSCRR